MVRKYSDLNKRFESIKFAEAIKNKTPQTITLSEITYLGKRNNALGIGTAFCPCCMGVRYHTCDITVPIRVLEYNCTTGDKYIAFDGTHRINRVKDSNSQTIQAYVFTESELENLVETPPLWKSPL